uniref:Mitochondrial calcium uniporter regulator 1 n=1 Tax=Oryzias sinensis TaxID=183150 RepID=A0A8C7XCU5_9TELE
MQFMIYLFTKEITEYIASALLLTVYPFISELSTSTRTLQYDMKPDIPKAQGRKLFFDTHAVVRLFEENGFSTQQAEVMVNVLMRTTNSNMDVVYSDMVTKVHQEIMLQRVMSQIAAVKKDMIILEKSEFSALLAENEVKDGHCQTLFWFSSLWLQDVIKKVRSDNMLDMNLEKSRVKELGLIRLLFWVFSQTAEQDRHFTETNMKIDTEVAGLKTMLESHKLDTIKYLAGEQWPFENKKKNNRLQLCFFLRKCVKAALGGVLIY